MVIGSALVISMSVIIVAHVEELKRIEGKRKLKLTYFDRHQCRTLESSTNWTMNSYQKVPC